MFLTVTLLETRTSTTPTKLLRLAPPRIRHEQSPIVPYQNVLHLLLRLLINILLVESHKRLGDALTNRVDLGSVTTAVDADPHVDASETVLPEEKHRLEDLESEDLWVEQLDRAAVELDQTAPASAVGDGDGRLHPSEALHGLFGLFRRHGLGLKIRCSLTSSSRSENPNAKVSGASVELFIYVGMIMGLTIMILKAHGLLNELGSR